MTLQYRTRENSLPNKKPRVYFTCHPDDFNIFFEKICEDIFKTHDCAIYYTKNMNEMYDEQNLDIDIFNMNVFVIPVTSKLLTTPNRAFDIDFEYAKNKHIPILPIMLETGIDELYSRPDKFGELQYVNPFSTDSTEISYEKKLRNCLDSVLISEEMAERVRAAFDAYVFLSYRKKDRHYANELIRLIHAKPELRDIAIWYDEFLVPGESFNENIIKMMKSSELFALLVTPSILEEPYGKPNFVMGKEYPLAKEMKMDILPTEMESTDRDELKSKFADIPESIDPNDDNLLKECFLKSISKIAKSEADDDPEHTFLIGLAYLDGIDVEVNRERGIELITKAAESGLIEAVKKLVNIYQYDFERSLDHRNVLRWQARLVSLCREQLLKHKKTEIDFDELMEYINSIFYLGAKYQDVSEYDEAMKNYYIIIDIAKKFSIYLGANSKIILASAYNNIAALLAEKNCIHDAITYNLKAITLREKVLRKLKSKAPDNASLDLMESYINLAVEYEKMRAFKKALTMLDKAYKVYSNYDLYIDILQLARLYEIRGSVYNSMGKRAESLREYVLAKKIYQDKMKYPTYLIASGYSHLLYLIGMSYADEMEYDKAETYFSESLEYYKCLAEKDAYGYVEMLVNTHYELALLYKEKKEYNKALEMLTVAERLCATGAKMKKITPLHTARIKAVKGEIYVYIREFEFGLEALKSAEKDLDTVEITYESAISFVNLYNTLGGAYYRMRIDDESQECYHKAFNLHQRYYKKDKSKKKILGILYFNFALLCYHNYHNKAAATEMIDKAIKTLMYIPDGNDLCLKALEFKRKYLSFFY